MSCGHYHGSYSHLRGPCRRRGPLPLARVEVPCTTTNTTITISSTANITTTTILQVSLLFEGCMRHETLWQLLTEKGVRLVWYTTIIDI